MYGKLNNPSWCCDRIQEKIEEYKRKIWQTSNIEVKQELANIVKDLEDILYN